MTLLNQALLKTIGCFCLLASASTFATNGYFTHGVGSKFKSLAGAGVGSNSDMGPIAVANNPALAVFTEQKTEIGLALFGPHRSYTPSDSLANGQGGAFTLAAGEYDSGSNLFPIPYVAKNWTLENERAITLVAYGRGGMNTDWNSNSASATFDPDGPGPAVPTAFPGVFGSGDAGIDLVQLFVSVNYAQKSSDSFAWGFGPIFAYQEFEAEGLSAFAPYTKTFALSGGTKMPTALSDNGHDSAFGIGAYFGFWWGLSDSLSAGMSYQTRIAMSEFDDYSDLFADSGNFDVPASIKGGISYLLDSGLRINLDVEHTQYGDVDSVGNEMALILSCPTAGLGGSKINTCLGGGSGAGFGWADMTSYKLGAEWPAKQGMVWRIGYSYGEQPVSRRDALFNILAPGVIEHHFTAGLSGELDSGNEWAVVVMYAPEKKVDGTNLFDPTQSIELKMYEYEVEVSYSF